jgi:F-type H+-transporting ATPase subunit b
MLIDWFTVVAQAVNFLVLVWLLQRFLYKPILHAMETREQTIASQLSEAEKHKVEAEADSMKFRRAREEFEKEKLALWRQVETDAEGVRQQLREKIRQEIEATRQKWREALVDEQAAFKAELDQGICREVFSIARNVLTDLAGTDLEERIAAIFIRRLEELNADEKEKLLSILGQNKQPAVIRSGFALPARARDAVEEAVDRLKPAGADPTIRYEIAPELVGGIELAADGRKVCWTIADYLSSLERKVQLITAQKTKNNGNVE